MEIYDVDGGSAIATIFDLYYSEYITINNVIVGTNINSKDSSVQFCDMDNTDGDIAISNVLISNHYSENTFYFSSSDYYDIYLTNITLDNVYGGTFFTFYYNYG